MKSIEESIVELDDFLAREAEAFESSAKKAAALDKPLVAQYSNGVAHAYGAIRAWIHTTILQSRVEPGEILTVLAIRQARGDTPERLARDVTKVID